MVFLSLPVVVGGFYVNVYHGVHWAQPLTSASLFTDHCLVLTVVDPSAPEGLRCVLFGSLSSLPPVKNVGDIVRFHRLKIQTYCSYLQGIQSPGFSALVFDGTLGAPIIPKATSLSFSFNAEQENLNVSKLRSWMVQVLPTSLTRGLMNIKPHSYLNLQCQLVAVADLDPRCSLLKVWDGTLCPFTPYSPPLDNVKLKSDLELLHRSKGLTIDIMVYDDHAQCASTLQVGFFLNIFNLHVTQPALSLKMDQKSDDRPRIHFVLHGTSAFGRGLKVLPEHSFYAFRIVVFFFPFLFRCSGMFALICFRCTATDIVITDHYQHRITPLTIVLSRTLLGKFRVRVKVVQYLPPQMYHCVKLFCPACQTFPYSRDMMLTDYAGNKSHPSLSQQPLVDTKPDQR
uniref:Protection of telomeres protein 1 n=1 Tax=Eptatretus burgeri TaxID=7764 RepID=A0A8C4QN24_EPTBU